MGKPVEVKNCRPGGFDFDSFSRMSPDMVKSIPDAFFRLGNLKYFISKFLTLGFNLR